MKLAQDSSQTKAAAALLGAGLPTPGENGSTSKKLAFAEDLRQQISQAVAGSRMRQYTSPAPATDAPATSNTAADGARTPSLATLPGSNSDHSEEQTTSEIAASGILLPLPDQNLPTAERSSDLLAAEDAPPPLTINAGFASPYDVLSPNQETIDSVSSSLAGQAVAPESLTNNPWQSVPANPVNTRFPEWNPIADPTESASATFLAANPEFATNADLAPSEYTNGLIPVAFDTRPSVTGIDTVESHGPELAATIDAALRATLPDVKIAQPESDVASVNLTPAYDLALPDVMPVSPFDNTIINTLQIHSVTPSGQAIQSASPLANMPVNGVKPLIESLQASSVDETATDEMQTQQLTAGLTANSASSLLQQAVDIAKEMVVAETDLKTKGQEAASGISTRSAYANNLLTNLLGASSDGSSTDNIPVPAQDAVIAMESLPEMSGGLIPAKSVISDQQLLASVGASSIETPSGLQGASIYNTDLRLQQAAEARLAHLQAIQNTNASVESATSRLTSSGLSGLDVTFGQAGWVERVGRQMLLQSAQGNSSAQIQLDPPELGSLMIRIQLVDQTATVNFVSPHAMVRDALEQQAQRLQEMFNEQGMNLRDISVSDQSANARQQSDRHTGGQHGSSSEQTGNQEQDRSSIEQKSVSLIDYYA